MYGQGFPAAQQFFPQNRLTQNFYPHPLPIYNTTMGYHIPQVFKPQPQVPSCMPLTTPTMMDGHGLSRFMVHNYPPASQEFSPKNRSKQNFYTHEPPMYEPVPSYSRWTVEEKYLEADIYVFWDMMTCPWPRNSDPDSIRHNIELALKNMNYRGTVVEFEAYGDVGTIHRDMLDALDNQEISFSEPGIKQAHALSRYYGDVCRAANYLVITDKDIRIKMNDDINFMIAAQEPQLRGLSLHKAVSVWQWDSLATGGLPLLNLETTNEDWFYNGILQKLKLQESSRV